MNEEAIERAFAAGDNATRIHFNVPAGTPLTNQYVLSFDAISLHTGDPLVIFDPRYGAEFYVNDVKVMDEVTVRPADVTSGKDYFSVPFTLESVHAQVGPGFDNVVTLKGINYNGDGGGNWMGIDYIALSALPQPVFPVQIGSDDNTHLRNGNGGGPNASFMQENGTVNALPGNPNNPETDGQSDNDYYLAGVYTNVLASVTAIYGDYTPIGYVVRNEESAERAFVPTNNELRYHFNLPNNLTPTNKLTVTFDPLDFDTRAVEAPNPRWDVEVLFNGHVVGALRQVTPADRDTDITTPAFTLQSVDAVVGLGTDNIVTLRGTPYNGDGGGSWMGIDYVKVDLEQVPALQLLMPVINKTAGTITIDWTGPGTPNLRWAPTVTGPWTTITAPAKPYVENIVSGENRFYQLIQ